MTKLEAKKILRTAFMALTPKQRERLREHARRRTPICCGEDYALFADGKGGA